MSTLAILKELQNAAEREAQGDKYAHVELLRGAQKLQNAITTPADKMTRLRFQMYQNVCVRLAQEHGVLQALAANGRMSAKELSTATKADELLIIRIMRLITQIGIADEVGPARYEANDATHYSIEKGSLGDVKYYAMGPLAQSGSKVDPHTHTFGKPLFPYLAGNPEYGQAFDDLMTVRRAPTWAKWFEIFPAKDKIGGSEMGMGDALLVDVGGGVGHWTQQFHQAFPDTPGRIILQDQPHVIAVTELDGIDTMAYDFFTPQPVVGARFYYFKQILHNWDDVAGVQILKNTAQAMKRGHSTLLIDDSVMPEEKVDLRTTCKDIAMMVTLGGGYERTQRQWETLMELAGLKVVKIWYDDGTNECTEAIIECEKL